MFSPYYARARARGSADPTEHCALNVALYGRPRRWCLTERPSRQVVRERALFAIGPSRLRWAQDALVWEVEEWTAPLPRRVCGTIRVRPEAWSDRAYTLDSAGEHRWQPLAPRARVEVRLAQPRLAWDGIGYLDCNRGDAPLEDAFRRWTWSRAQLSLGTAVLYDIVRRDGSRFAFALRFEPGGAVAALPLAAPARLPRTFWGIERTANFDAPVRLVATLEDTPFYARSLLRAQLAGEEVTAIHEALDLDRFRARWVKWLLGFRMLRSRR